MNQEEVGDALKINSEDEDSDAVIELSTENMRSTMHVDVDVFETKAKEFVKKNSCPLLIWQLFDEGIDRIEDFIGCMVKHIIVSCFFDRHKKFIRCGRNFKEFFSV